MPRYLLSVLRPQGWTPGDDPGMMPAIDAVNHAMQESDVRRFVGGLTGPELAITCTPGDAPRPGPATEPPLFLNGLWVIEVEGDADAADWAQRAAEACRATVETRRFHG